MLSTVFSFITGLVGRLIEPIAFYVLGRNKAEKDIAEEENEKLRNRPRTMSDVRKRLLDSLNK